MSEGRTLILAAIAGGTIFLGLPLGRLRSLSGATRAGLSAVATGILVFLLWDVLSGAVKPMEGRLEVHAWGSFAGYSALALLGFSVGLMGLVYYAEWMRGRSNRRASNLVGPGAAAVDEFEARTGSRLTAAQQLALLIAVGIGVHNFGEGLAIGQAAATGAASLAVTLILGFALHNATEGFGICGPLGNDEAAPSWSFLALLGLIGGGPTFLGTLVGHAWTSEAVTVVFFTVAAGSILYVVQELFAANRRYGHPVLVAWLLVLGLVLGFATDFVIDAAGI